MLCNEGKILMKVLHTEKEQRLGETCTSSTPLQTLRPSWAALTAATYPPGPDPTTTRSSSSGDEK